MSPSRRRTLRLGAVALAGSIAGCAGMLEEVESTETTDSDESAESTGTTDSGEATTERETTAFPIEVDTALPEGSVEFPAGPKSRPKRPTVLTAETVREYVLVFERRWVYNRLYRDETTTVHRECGVDSVAEYGEGFRVVVWCSAWAETGRDGTTLHADYFTQYATYFVGPTSTVRRNGKSGERR